MIGRTTRGARVPCPALVPPIAVEYGINQSATGGRMRERIAGHLEASVGRAPVGVELGLFRSLVVSG